MNQKDTIYIDIDDEITAIIEKLRGSEQKIVALVLPKRAAVLQSIVNMKLLKRSAEKAKKHVVLITTEAGLLPLAGVVGLHVAATLQSKPAIPRPDAVEGATIDLTEDDEDFDPDAVAAEPIGKLAGVTPVVADEPETIELDDDEPVGSGPAAGATAGAAGLAGGTAAEKAAKAPKKNKKLSIPNFNKFRVLIILGGLLLVGLLIFLYFAAFVLPKATITVATDSSTIATNTNLTLDPAAKTLDLAGKLLPAKIEQKQQTGTQQVTTTGQKNKGTKATGEVTLSLDNCDVDDVTVPAGTGVSSGGKTFITQSSANMQSVEIGGVCRNDDFEAVSTKKVSVVAQSAGAGFNIAPASFTVAGFTNISGASADATTGGTDNIVKTVSQTDIDTAKQKMTAQDTTAIKTELGAKLKTAGYMSLPSSLVAGEPVVTTSAAVGDETDTVTVTQATAYTIYGVMKTDVKALIMANVNKSIDSKKQKVLNDGVDKAEFEITSPAASGPLTVALSAETVAGPDIDAEAIKSAIAGKKTNDVRTLIKATPGVTDVTVKYSPFWVSSVPKKTSKIIVLIDKADAGTDVKTDTTPDDKP